MTPEFPNSCSKPTTYSSRYSLRVPLPNATEDCAEAPERNAPKLLATLKLDMSSVPSELTNTCPAPSFGGIHKVVGKSNSALSERIPASSGSGALERPKLAVILVLRLPQGSTLTPTRGDQLSVKV